MHTGYKNSMPDNWIYGEKDKMSNIIIVTLACDDDPQTGAHIVIEHVLIQLNMCNGIWEYTYCWHFYRWYEFRFTEIRINEKILNVGLVNIHVY